jgi:hypothetical protein
MDEIKIINRVVKTVIGNKSNKKEIIVFLFKRQADKIKIINKMVKKAAKN